MATGYFNGNDPNDAPESSKRKRAMAEALMRSIAGQPAHTIGQGIASLGNAALARALMNQADTADQAGLAGATSAFNSAISGLGSPGVDPTTTGSTGSALTGDIATYANAIKGNESSGRYDIIGPTHPKYGRALGAYQVMEANLPQWSRDALGREVSADEFLANPGIQDQIFAHRFGGYVQKYGNPQDAASAWLTGRPRGPGNTSRDVFGTDSKAYVNKFNANMGGTQASAAPPGPDAVKQQIASLLTNRSAQQPSSTTQAISAALQGREPVQVASLDADAEMANVALGPDTSTDDAQKRQMVAKALMGSRSRVDPSNSPFEKTMRLVAALNGKGDRLPPSAAPLPDAAFAARVGGASPISPLSDPAAAARIGARDGRPRVADIYGLDPYAAKMPVPTGANAMSGGAWLGSPAMRGQEQAVPGGGAGSALASQFASLPDQVPVPAARPPMPLPPQQFDARAPMPGGDVASAGPYLDSPRLQGATPDIDQTQTAAIPAQTRSHGLPVIDHHAHATSAIERALAVADRHHAATGGPQYQGGFDRAGIGQGGPSARTARTVPAGETAMRSQGRGLLGFLGLGAAPQGGSQASAGAPQPGSPPTSAGGSQEAPQASGTGSLQELLQAASNPYLTDTQREILGDLIKQKRRETDPDALLDRRYKEAQIDAAKRRGHTLINAGDGNIYDQDAEKWLTAPGGGTKAPSTQLGKLMAERDALPADDPRRGSYDAAIAKEAAGSGMSVETHSDGTTTITQGSGGGKGDKLTEGQSKDIGYWTRGSEADKQLASLDKYLPDFKQANADKIPLGLGNYVRTKEFRQAKVAADQFLSAVLRKDTGAAITDGEFQLYGPMFLPVPGDDAETMTQKRRMRGVALMGIRSGLGTADAIAQANALTLGLPDDGTLPAYDPNGENASPSAGAPAQGGVGRGSSPTSSALPPDVSEEDVQFTMKKYGMTRDQVVKELQNAP